MSRFGVIDRNGKEWVFESAQGYTWTFQELPDDNRDPSDPNIVEVYRWGPNPGAEPVLVATFPFASAIFEGVSDEFIEPKEGAS